MRQVATGDRMKVPNMDREKRLGESRRFSKWRQRLTPH